MIPTLLRLCGGKIVNREVKILNLYIADMHFGHSNAILFDHRPFSSRDEMDEVMIKLWNNRVRPDDDVYILGDFAFRSGKAEQWYLRQLRGRKHLVIGNHDGKLLENEKAMSYFESVDKMMHVEDQGNHISLCHFPILQWNGRHKGHLHIYGHIHGTIDETTEIINARGNAFNAGCMINNYAPVSLRELIENNRRYYGLEDRLF